MPDFRNEDFRSNNWLCKVTPGIISAQFDYFKDLMLWIQTEGMQLLQSSTPLSLQQWESLWQKVEDLHTIFGSRQRTVCVLQMLVFRKGVESLLHFVQNDPQASNMESAEWEAYRQWFHFLVRGHFERDSIFGWNSHYCYAEERREMVESLIPIAHLLNWKVFMDQIAYARFPGDPGAIQMFKNQHPDIPSTKNEVCTPF